MKTNIKQTQSDLAWLRDSCFFHLNKVTEYLSEDKSNEDFSDQLSSAQAIYSIDKYERALRCLNLTERENEDIDFLRDSLCELLDDNNRDFLTRFRRFCDDYFSSNRFQDMIELVRQSVIGTANDSNSFPDSETRDDIADEVCDIVSIKDQVNLLSRERATFLKYVVSFKDSENMRQDWVSYLSTLDKSISDIFEKYRDLWAIFSDDIKLHREMMLVPADEEERWWSLVPEITPATIVKGMRMRSNTVNVITGIVKNNDTEGLFDNWGDQIEKTVGAIMNSDPDNAKRINNIISEMPNAQQFAQYGYAGFSPPQSTHIETFARVTTLLGDVIDDLIRTIEEYETIDDDERNRLLAVAYMVRGYPDKAREILAEE
jgi:hypothetical protein|tara:strand:- start:2695 stop:3816 length:1122 start_codon:yes stop_codon:yes gene_type:complete